MTAIPFDRTGTCRPTLLAALAGATFAAASLFSGPPAFAQEPQQGWEVGCAYKSLPTGNGEALRTWNCERQKVCQELANAEGKMTMELGCFGVQPIAKPTAAQPGRLRPTQQQ